MRWVAEVDAVALELMPEARNQIVEAFGEGADGQRNRALCGNCIVLCSHVQRCYDRIALLRPHFYFQLLPAGGSVCVAQPTARRDAVEAFEPALAGNSCILYAQRPPEGSSHAPGSISEPLPDLLIGHRLAKHLLVLVGVSLTAPLHRSLWAPRARASRECCRKSDLPCRQGRSG